jgi:energy-coupling factor transport system ATP-binding protein
MTPAVEVRDLFCLYRGTGGDVAAVRGLSLVVEPGERVVVQGPNGSGKTTLLRVLLGEQRPSAGVVHVGGQSVRAWGGAGLLADAASAASRARQRGRSIGYVEQSAARVLRPEISVLDNVALQLRLGGLRHGPARELAGEVLDRLGLAAFSGRAPDTLSGGEAQRVGVAAAIAHGPSLLLADEPSGALDRETADNVYDLLSQAATSTGAALLLVSHDDGAARVADRVVRIRDGRVSEQWEPGHAQETLVVDDRGWVRLPEVLRRSTGSLSGVVASLHDGAIRLVGTTVPVAPPAPGAEPGGASVSPSDLGSENRPAAFADHVSVTRVGRTVLDAVDLDVPVGALTVVHGRSGSGKSTMLRLLAGLDRPESGRVEVAGTDLGSLDRNGLADLRRARVAYSGQSVQLAEALNVAETLQLARAGRGLPNDDELVDDWLAALDLDGLRARQVRLLSGGERQRLAVARALSVQADLVLVDEPTAQLDEAHAELLAEALRYATKRGTAVVAASHDPVLTSAADGLLALD